MNLSELIKRLQSVQATEGDLTVLVIGRGNLKDIVVYRDKVSLRGDKS